MKFLSAFLLCTLMLINCVGAGELLNEAPNDTRLKIIASQLRCPVCQGESLFDSHAALAKEMKLIIREKIANGVSDQDILDFFQQRYGNYVLMRPAFNSTYALLWIAPFAFMFLAIMIFIIKWRSHSQTPLPADHQQQSPEQQQNSPN